MNKNRFSNTIKNMGTSLLAGGTTIRIKAHGYSMYPSVKPGSLLIIEPIKVKGDPKPGELIVIKRESGLIVHRLVKIVIKDGIRWYIARGDSNAYADKPVRIEMIAGRVTGSEATGENRTPADIRIKERPNYIMNRLRVIFIFLRMKFKLK
jgi:signal peptidase I